MLIPFATPAILRTMDIAEVYDVPADPQAVVFKASNSALAPYCARRIFGYLVAISSSPPSVDRRKQPLQPWSFRRAEETSHIAGERGHLSPVHSAHAGQSRDRPEETREAGSNILPKVAKEPRT